MDTTERRSTKAVVWQGSMRDLVLHTDNLLVLRGQKAGHRGHSD